MQDPEREVLVVGATGNLGSEVVRLLSVSGYRTRALVRSGNGALEDEHAAARRARVAQLASETIVADLTLPETLVHACEGVRSVVSTATALLSRRSGDSLESVDRAGHLALVDAAERAGVKHFCYVSFLPTPFQSEFQSAKRAVEARLRASSMTHTIIQATAFMEVWLSPAMGFSPETGRVRILGSGNAQVSWVSIHDVARFAAASLERPRFENTTVELGGPDALSPLQVLKIFEELGARGVVAEFVPETALQTQLNSAPGPRAQAFAAAMLTTAQGQVVNPELAQTLLAGRLRTVRDFAATQLNRTSVAP